MKGRERLVPDSYDLIGFIIASKVACPTSYQDSQYFLGIRKPAKLVARKVRCSGEREGEFKIKLWQWWI
jgi:hypothetical protein